ncbi:MAG: aminoacyl-tRNA hydrolase [Deltaproteobacteria bacterium]|nr:aminoacyl-tRNA hydrolase [Deltaproteobacteria bacterium]
MIEITKGIFINESEIKEEFIRSSGPGGQHVNKVATAVQLRFDVANSPSLPIDIRNRLLRIAGKRVTEEGVLIIEARRYRSQEKNRKEAFDRLVKWIVKATQKPKIRRKTKPTYESIRRRLESKRRRSQIKKLRRLVTDSEI